MILCLKAKKTYPQKPLLLVLKLNMSEGKQNWLECCECDVTFFLPYIPLKSYKEYAEVWGEKEESKERRVSHFKK